MMAKLGSSVRLKPGKYTQLDCKSLIAPPRRTVAWTLAISPLSPASSETGM
jgi:hypothetical protein